MFIRFSFEFCPYQQIIPIKKHWGFLSWSSFSLPKDIFACIWGWFLQALLIGLKFWPILLGTYWLHFTRIGPWTNWVFTVFGTCVSVICVSLMCKEFVSSSKLVVWGPTQDWPVIFMRRGGSIMKTKLLTSFLNSLNPFIISTNSLTIFIIVFCKFF